MNHKKCHAALLEGGGKLGGGQFVGGSGGFEEFAVAEDIYCIFLFVGDLPHESSFAHAHIVGERFIVEFQIETGFPFFHSFSIGGVENSHISVFGFLFLLLGMCRWKGRGHECHKKQGRKNAVLHGVNTKGIAV